MTIQNPVEPVLASLDPATVPEQVQTVLQHFAQAISELQGIAGDLESRVKALEDAATGG